MKHVPIHTQVRTAVPHRPPVVVVVGGGFTGAAATVALAKAASGPLSIVIVEPANAIGQGLAYGRAGAGHLLNVPASELSVHADRPGDFADWASASLAAGGGAARSYLPRKAFGRYVRDRLHEARLAAPHVAVASTRDTALEVRPVARGLSVLLRNGGPVFADAVVLATGYGVRHADRGLGADPFAPLDPDRMARAGHAVCVGTGLTMVDALVALRAAGFGGRVTALSRRGLLPQAQPAAPIPAYPETIPLGSTAGEIARALRLAMADAQARGLPWQSAVQALRRQAAEQWAALAPAEQARILRHALPYWTTARHRLPPESGAMLRREIESGGLTVRRARALGVDRKEDRFDVLLRPAGGGVERLEADVVLDCAGWAPAPAGSLDASLERHGIGRRGPHGLGIAVQSDGAVLDAGGSSRGDLFALGPAGQGSLLEITAVPEIVRQAGAAAAVLAQRLGARSVLAA